MSRWYVVIADVEEGPMSSEFFQLLDFVIAQANPELERIQSLIGVTLVLVFAVGVIGFAIWRFLSFQKAQKNARDTVSTLGRLLDQRPVDESIHAELETIASKFPVLADTVYRMALCAVESSRGAPAAKRFALSVGRRAYGSKRSNGRPTIYDEQAIQNDIGAREA